VSLSRSEIAMRGRDDDALEPMLDRMIDNSRYASGDIRAIRDSVRAELERLLNTRWRCREWPPNLEELEQSLVNYGIPDFSGASFRDSRSQRELRKLIERAIRLFEPRCQRVKVSVVTDSRRDRKLRFRIETELVAQGHREGAVFESTLDVSSSTFSIKQ
jgi:type VI secretion system protein ImpF